MIILRAKSWKELNLMIKEIELEIGEKISDKEFFMNNTDDGYIEIIEA